jgi:hypothetical protein
VSGTAPELESRTRPWWGFGWGAGTGVVLTLLALGASGMPGAVEPATVGAWIDLNLGSSVWLFALVLTVYVLNLTRLQRLLANETRFNQVVELDQLLDVWIHLFVGIGVIWTAVGMRSALQAALGDPGQTLTDNAGSVLRRLVDGGILLALSTTIVGGVGSYLMRLVKTMTVGAALNVFYDTHNRAQLTELVTLTRRLDAALSHDPVTPRLSEVRTDTGDRSC